MDFFQDDFFQRLTPQPQARVFLGWDRPLAHAAAEFLNSHYGNCLPQTLVIVPSRQSARRLRHGLEQTGLPHGLPKIATPESLYTPAEGDETQRQATAGQTLLAWALALQKTRLSNLRNLFPIDPPERGFSWAMGTAADLLSLRSTLGEAALLMADVPEKFGSAFADTPRWRELARLETEACSRLEEAGLVDAATLRQHLSGSPSPPDGVSNIALVGLPDPPGIALRALENLIADYQVTAAVFAPPSEASRFDAWGRPTEEGWSRARIEIAEEAIHLCADPAAQSANAAERLVAEPGTAVSVADPDLIAPLQSALSKKQIATHLPAGHPLSSHEIFALLRLLADLVESRSFTAAAELARHPDLLAAAAASYQGDGDPFDLAAALHGLDRIAVEHLPATLGDALHFATRDYVHREISPPSIRHLLSHISTWLDRLTGEPLADSLPAFLDQTFAGREADTDFETVRTLLDDQLAAIAPLAGKRFDNADALGLVIAVLGGEALPEARAENSIDLQGWLETLWDDTPGLVIVGVNDGSLPESMSGDPFLPNKARRDLGIRDSNSRLVRDSYLLTAILESRRNTGRVDLVLGRTNEDGDPLRPSRLLFRCADEELPARALRLCKGEDLEPAPSPAWSAAWQLQPPPLPSDSTIGERISVTGFRGYLACPFRYYLRFGLGMEELDSNKVEMDARDFGNLCHNALEDFGDNESLRDSTDEAAIRGYLIERLEVRTFARYGRHLSVPLAFQLESAKQRLSWAATIQVSERKSGWKIVHSEWKIHENSDWKIGGLTVRGTIDRIEKNERDGYWRVLDYKTSASAKSPPQAHLARVPRDSEPDAYPDYALTDAAGSRQHWTDLQVPLYVLALRELKGAEKISAGYFNLARSSGETQIQTWDTLDENILDSARSCAEGIATSIRNGIFWPPAPTPQFDDFESILFNDAAELALPPSR